MQELDAVWKALSNPMRRSVMDHLCEGPKTTGEIAEAFPALSRFAVMQHLGVLEGSGLILVRREGRKRFNYLNPVPLRQMYERWVSGFASVAADQALGLKRYVERTEPMQETAGKIVKIETEIRLKARPERVFAALTVELPKWWPFRFKPGSPITVEPWVGGRMFEDWGDGKGALYGTIVTYDPPLKLCTTGGGAMNQGMTSFNVDSVEVDGDGAIYRKSLILWGDVSEELEEMFTSGSKALMYDSLKAYVEEGKEYAS